MACKLNAKPPTQAELNDFHLYFPSANQKAENVPCFVLFNLLVYNTS